MNAILLVILLAIVWISMGIIPIRMVDLAGMGTPPRGAYICGVVLGPMASIQLWIYEEIYLKKKSSK